MFCGSHMGLFPGKKLGKFLEILEFYLKIGRFWGQNHRFSKRVFGNEFFHGKMNFGVWGCNFGHFWPIFQLFCPRQGSIALELFHHEMKKCDKFDPFGLIFERKCWNFDPISAVFEN